MERVRVLLADDHTTARAGMRAILADTWIEVVAEVSEGTSAIERALELKPDVAVVDYNLPGLTGADLTILLLERVPETKVLILTAHEDRTFLKHALEAGAKGYVLKRAAAAELVQAIRVVANNCMYLDPRMTSHVIESFIKKPTQNSLGSPDPILSAREEDVLRLVALGYSNKEVAVQLHVSVKTVETHKFRAMEKLELNDRVDLIKYAHDHDWLKRE